MKLFSFIVFSLFFLTLLLFNPPTSYAQYCGDLACNGGELCSSCTQDCGACAPINHDPIGGFENVINATCQAGGWAFDPDAPSTSINIRIYKDRTSANSGGTYIGEYVANVARDDVNSYITYFYGYPATGKHGFNVYFADVTGLKDGQNHTIWIYAQDTQNNGSYHLNASPKTINCPPPPPPTCSSAGPDGVIINPGTTLHTLNAYGVAHANRVLFATWTDVGGQDDLVWHEGVAQGGGTWSYTVNTDSHPGVGGVSVHVYMIGTNGAGYWCDTANFYKNAGPNTTAAYINNTTTVFPNGNSSGGGTQYLIVMTATDANGAADITDQYAAVNIYGQARGIVGWSGNVTEPFYWWGSNITGNRPACYNYSTGLNEGTAVKYLGYGPDYVYVDSCYTYYADAVTRVTAITVRFDSSFGTPKINYMYGFSADKYHQFDPATWEQLSQFTLQNSLPKTIATTINPKPVNPDGTTTYTIQVRSQDANGVSDIYDQWALINYQGPVYAGMIRWSGDNFNRYWGTGSAKPGSLKSCTGIGGIPGGQAAIYGDASFHPEVFTSLDSCTTEDTGNNTRTTTFYVKFNSSLKTVAPATNNRVWGWESDATDFDPAGWFAGDLFDLTQPNLFLTAGSVQLRYGYGATPNCNNGTLVPNGGGVPNGTTLEVCVTYGNNGNATTGAYNFSNYINQPSQPAYGTAGNYTWNTGNTPVQGASVVQLGSVVVNSAVCSSNCRVGAFIDRDNAIAESNESDNFATSGLYNVVAATTFSGNIWVDTRYDHCNIANGALSAYSGARTVTLRDSVGSTIGTHSVAGQAYSISSIPGTSYTASLSLPVGTTYTVDTVNYSGTGFGATPGLTGFMFDPAGAAIDMTSATRTLDWCLRSTQGWIKTGDGDVRFGTLLDPVPLTLSPTSDANSAFFSSNSVANFGSAATVPGFIVSREYTLYNDDPKTKQGLFSYSFFRNRAKIKGLTLATVPGCIANQNCTITALTDFPTSTLNTPYYVNGNLTIDGYTHKAGTHILLLVNGNVTINGNIKVPAGANNLFVIAAGANDKSDTSIGNIYVSSNVGSAPSSACITHNPVQAGDYSCANLEGIYSAEKSFVLQTKQNCPGTSDNQLTMAGNVITNSLKPFAVGGTGVFDFTKRSLCSNDANFPVFVMLSRYDFVLQLTDFYKTPSVRWKEVNP